ncbi:helix-turn-helix transcriptional regulator [Blastococcus sp. SYSU DS0619]
MARRASGDDVRPIHNRVNVARAEVGMSRADLARLVGVNPQTIGALERGDHYPSLQLAMSICEVFDLPVEALFSREPFRPLTASYRRTDLGGGQ